MICRTIAQLRNELSALRSRGSVGLVPTMGNLHDGHAQLIARSCEDNAVTIVSVFVNPLQFGPNEDFASYPRTLDADLALMRAHEVDLVFAPTDEEMYPLGREGSTRVCVPEISSVLCGAHRPGHFDGVTTVVLKLLNAATPTRAYFGEKDYQQLTLIRKMVRDLDVAVEIVGVPTVRAADGLALSSRNQYLSETQRRTAPILAKTLRALTQQLAAGNRDFPRLIREAQSSLDAAGFHTDYVAIHHPLTLAPSTMNDRTFVVLAAARLGKARLIDNMQVST